MVVGIATTQNNIDDDDHLRLRVLMLLIVLKLYNALLFSLVSSADDGPPSFTSIAVSVNKISGIIVSRTERTWNDLTEAMPLDDEKDWIELDGEATQQST